MAETEYIITRGDKYTHYVWNSAPLLIVGERVYDLRRLAGWTQLAVAAAAKCWLSWVTHCTTVIEERAAELVAKRENLKGDGKPTGKGSQQ